jgi:hypothetical protein
MPLRKIGECLSPDCPEVQFSNGTKKSVGYNRGETLPPITALLGKILAIQAKAKLQQ